MARMAKWLRDIKSDLEKIPEYKTETEAFKIAVQVQNRLHELNITQKDFADRLGVSRSYVTQILKGKTNMTISSLVKIASVLDMEPEINLKSYVETKPNAEFEVIDFKRILDQTTGATGMQIQDMFIISHGNTAATSDLSQAQAL